MVAISASAQSSNHTLDFWKTQHDPWSSSWRSRQANFRTKLIVVAGIILSALHGVRSFNPQNYTKQYY